MNSENNNDQKTSHFKQNYQSVVLFYDKKCQKSN